jgi:hypothetical protein
MKNNFVMGLVFLGVMAAVGAFLWGAFSLQKSEDAKKMRARLTEVCGQEQECLAAIDTHFENCFSSSYVFRRRGTGLNPQKFTGCMNTKAGKEFFTYQP